MIKALFLLRALQYREKNVQACKYLINTTVTKAKKRAKIHSFSLASMTRNEYFKTMLYLLLELRRSKANLLRNTYLSEAGPYDKCGRFIACSTSHGGCLGMHRISYWSRNIRPGSDTGYPVCGTSG